MSDDEKEGEELIESERDNTHKIERMQKTGDQAD